LLHSGLQDVRKAGQDLENSITLTHACMLVGNSNSLRQTSVSDTYR